MRYIVMYKRIVNRESEMKTVGYIRVSTQGQVEDGVSIDTTSAAGKMVFRMLAVLAEFERDQVSDRTRFALAHKRSKGKKTGGDVPFGFRVREGQLYPIKAEQKIINQIMKMRKEGLTLRGICRYLEDGGIVRKNGSKRWHPQSVADIINRRQREIAIIDCQPSSEG